MGDMRATDMQPDAQNIELGAPITSTTALPLKSPPILEGSPPAEHSKLNHGEGSHLPRVPESDIPRHVDLPAAEDEPRRESSSDQQRAMEAAPSSSVNEKELQEKQSLDVGSKEGRKEPGQLEPAANALLNLPPPLPFNLAVTNLWVGVPHGATPS
jgi:hypothetical protein